jgi:hypothetical protein
VGQLQQVGAALAGPAARTGLGCFGTRGDESRAGCLDAGQCVVVGAVSFDVYGAVRSGALVLHEDIWLSRSPAEKVRREPSPDDDPRACSHGGEGG